MTTFTPTRRRSAWRWLGGLLLVLMLATAVAAVAGAVLLVQALPADLAITIDGEQLDLGLDAVDAGMLLLGLGVALLALVVLVPLVLLFGLAVPVVVGALGVVATLLVAGLAVAVVASPLILLGVLLWWALRPRRPQASASPAAPRPVALPRPPVVGQHTDNARPFA